jgi:pimeloyl-ACP methyl ester carboxylesterase
VDTIEAGRHRIAYERRGDGAPVVLLHGYVCDRRAWRGQLEDLSDEFTVVAWDAPGFGGSSDPPDPFSLADFADCLAAFVDALELRRPHIVGLSFGGGLALELYRRHPALPQTLVLASAYAGWAGSLPPDLVEFRLQQALRLAELSPEQLIDELLPTLFGESAPQAGVDEFVAGMREFHPAGLRATSRAFAVADLRDVLPEIAVPTLLIYDDRDVRAPLNVARELHARIPRFQARRARGHRSPAQRRGARAVQRRGARVPRPLISPRNRGCGRADQPAGTAVSARDLRVDAVRLRSAAYGTSAG